MTENTEITVAELRAYSLQEISRRMNFSVPSLYKEARAGRLKLVKFGRATRVLEADLRAWLNMLRAGSKS